MQAVVLAAGTSSRFWPLNTRHKSLTRIQGRTLLEHTLAGLQKHDITDVVIVQGPNEDIEAEIQPSPEMNVTFVVQDEPRGMGNAVQQAQDDIEDVFIVTGPYRFDIDALLDNMLPTEGSDGAVIGSETTHPERYGMLDVSSDGTQATGIVEKPAPGQEPSPYKIISTYILTPEFFDHLAAVEEQEYSFEDALQRYMEDNTVAFTAVDEEPPSLKYPWDLFDITESLLDRQEPSISDTADVAESAVIDGNVVIADDAKIYEHAVIRGPCYIGENVTVGNNAVVRAYANIEADSSIGANAEVRGSVIQNEFSCHSGFIGDSLIGRNVSVGAGTVTANRLVDTGEGRPEISVYVEKKEERVTTGRDRMGAIIGDNVDIGTHANLMPGICIGRGSFIGPSTMVRENVAEAKTYYTKTESVERDR